MSIRRLSSRLLGSGGSASGVMGAVGSIHNVCHSICVGIVSLAAVFGITLTVLPLMFLQTYQRYFWQAALLFTAVSFYFYLRQRHKHTFDRNLLLVNFGMLIFGLPVSGALADYVDFFRFTGGVVALSGLGFLLLGKKLTLVHRSLPESSSPSGISQQPGTEQTAPAKTIGSAFTVPQLSVSSVLFAIVAGGFLVNQYLMYRMNVLGGRSAPAASALNQMGQAASRMRLTVFDVALAKERMDKDNDGRCDVCGMSIQQCIDSGQLDCNMGNNPTTIGVLGSQHIHMDWKIYINGKALAATFFDALAMDMSNPNEQTTSSFIHVDKGAPAPEKTGDLIHMHAQNVPLWVLFRSVGVNLTIDSLTFADGKIYKNGNGNILKFYVNGKKVDELGDYVFQDLDKLLISYGPANDPDIPRQLDSVTSFSNKH